MEEAKEYDIRDPDELIPCPYEDAHHIRACRMTYHLMRCRRNHPLVKMDTCPYNAMHEVPVPELRYHMATCPDKHRLTPHIAQEYMERDSETQGCLETPRYTSTNYVGGESWEHEILSHPRVGINPPAQVHRVQPEPTATKLLSPELTQGMTGRQKQMLYLKLKQKMGEQIPAELRAQSVDERLRVPSQPAQSLALHQQQNQQQQQQQQQQRHRQTDIYQRALGANTTKGPGRESAIGRGTQWAAGGVASGPGMRNAPPSGPAGDWPSLGSGVMTSPADLATQAPAGRGRAAWPLGDGPQATVSPPRQPGQAPWGRMSAPSGHQGGDLGRGRSPYLGQGVATGQGRSLGPAANRDDRVDGERFQDAPTWVGDGYTDHPPLPSRSAESLTSNPSPLASWADEVERSFPQLAS